MTHENIAPDAPIVKQMISVLKTHWKSLLLTDLLFKAIAYSALVPLVSLIFRLFLYFSGRDILADTDIANFLLHPLGWLAVVIVGGALTGISALEIGTLMAIILSGINNRRLQTLTALEFIYKNAIEILRLTSRMVARLLLLAAPFIILGGGLFFIFLTEYDINFYLTEKPPIFVTVVGMIGIVLTLMSALLLRQICRWAVAIPCLLFESTSPDKSLAVSKQRMAGQELQFSKWIGLWLTINILIGSAVSGLVFFIGQQIIPETVNSVFILITLLGMLLTIWAVVNFLTQIFGAITLALTLSFFYQKNCRGEIFHLPDQQDDVSKISVNLTPMRITAGMLLMFFATSIVGFAAVGTVRLEDNVEITAHRGASAAAPENTLAAIHQAITDETDWVEIDVQESKDGVVVVAHDSDLKKVAGNPIKIWEGTAEELRSIDIGSYFDPKFHAERVPTLSEVLEVCKGKVGLNIELKYYGHTQNLEQKVVDLVEQHGMADSVVIMSLKQAGVQKVQKLRPDWTVGLLTAVSASDITRAKVDFLAVSTKLATRSFIESAHRKDKRVHVWTVNDAPTMSLMIGRGADNLITDHPDLARRVLKERESLSPLQRVLIEFSFLFGTTESPVVEQ